MPTYCDLKINPIPFPSSLNHYLNEALVFPTKAILGYAILKVGKIALHFPFCLW